MGRTRGPPVLHLLLMIPQGAHVVALCDALGQIQHRTVALADAVVTAHGNVAGRHIFL